MLTAFRLTSSLHCDLSLAINAASKLGSTIRSRISRGLSLGLRCSPWQAASCLFGQCLLLHLQPFEPLRSDHIGQHEADFMSLEKFPQIAWRVHLQTYCLSWVSGWFPGKTSLFLLGEVSVLIRFGKVHLPTNRTSISL